MLLNVTLGFAIESKTFLSTSMLCTFLYFMLDTFVCTYSSLTVLEWHFRDQLWLDKLMILGSVDSSHAYITLDDIQIHTVSFGSMGNFFRFVDIRMIWVLTLELSGGMMLGNSYNLCIWISQITGKQID